MIDLRPTPGPDGILLVRDGSARDGDGGNEGIGSDVARRAIFPLAGRDESSADEAEMDRRAASSHSVGNVCSTVYLIIAYDFDNGKTMLHRSFGGAKLMAFVDGVRSRRHREMNDAATDEIGEEASTKLVLVFVPSSSSSAMTLLSNISSSSTTPENNLLDLTKNNDKWDASGANFLVDRLSEAFALGGEVYRNMEPFAVEMVGAFNVGQEKEQVQGADNTSSATDSEIHEDDEEYEEISHDI